MSERGVATARAPFRTPVESHGPALSLPSVMAPAPVVAPVSVPRPGPVAPRRTLFGLRIDAMSLDQAVDQCERAVRTRQGVLVGVVNAAKVVNLRADALLRDSLLDCDLLLADGQSVVWASWLLRQPLPERVAGIDLFQELLTLAHRDKRSVYLLGAKADVLTRLEANLAERFPGLQIAGSRDGYFTAAEAPTVAGDIRRSGADMLFLGMVSPKKEIFVGEHGPTLGVPVIHGVGGSFDVLAGVTRRAPGAWQKAGLEWAYRLLQEPGRLWRRYLVTNCTFVWLAARELVRRSAPYTSTQRPYPIVRADPKESF